MPQEPIHLDPGIQPVLTGGTKGMKKYKGYGLLWMLAAEVVLFIFFLAIASVPVRRARNPRGSAVKRR